MLTPWNERPRKNRMLSCTAYADDMDWTKFVHITKENFINRSLPQDNSGPDNIERSDVPATENYSQGEFQELQITPTHIVLEANNHSNIYRTTVNDKLGYNSYRCKNQYYIDSP
ncbi:unnamed protein product [Rhizophagus irregularis]|nr:unnamed protein product [Rhizophagus irregularis]